MHGWWCKKAAWLALSAWLAGCATSRRVFFLSAIAPVYTTLDRGCVHPLCFSEQRGKFKSSLKGKVWIQQKVLYNHSPRLIFNLQCSWDWSQTPDSPASEIIGVHHHPVCLLRTYHVSGSGVCTRDNRWTSSAYDLQWIKSHAIHSPRWTEWYFQRSRPLIQASDYGWKMKERHDMQGHNTCKAKGMDELVSSDSWTLVRLAKRCQD